MRTTYEDFRTNLINEITRLMPEARPEFCEIQKINGTVVEGLQMQVGNSSTAPVFYPHSLYEDDPDDCRMIAAYIVEKTREAFPYGEDLIKDITSFETIKDRVIIKLINKAKNDTLLFDAPHTTVLDLAATYAVDLGNANDRGDSALVQVKNPLFGLWGVDVKTLHATALDNTRERLGLSLKSLQDVLRSLGQVDCDPGFPVSMWILTNDKNLYGASTILLPKAKEMIGEVFGNCCYAIPSSVHEWILVPLNDVSGPADINGIIEEVNATALKPEEFLGDHMYLYDEGELKMV